MGTSGFGRFYSRYNTDSFVSARKQLPIIRKWLHNPCQSGTFWRKCDPRAGTKAPCLIFHRERERNCADGKTARRYKSSPPSHICFCKVDSPAARERDIRIFLQYWYRIRSNKFSELFHGQLGRIK